MSRTSPIIANSANEPLARRSASPRAGSAVESIANVRFVGSAPRTVIPENRESVRGADPTLSSHALLTHSPIVITTINPAIGDTGVQTHTRALHEGLAAAGLSCSVQTPFSRPAKWLPIFGVRKLLGPVNRTWSTRWYR